MKIFARKADETSELMDEECTETKLVVESDGKIIVAHQNLRFVPKILSENYCDWVQVLDLSHNKLRDLRFLRNMTVLHTLILDHNLLVSSSFFPRLPSLRILWLNYNLISDMRDFVPRLGQSCPGLEHLSLMGNLAASHFVTGGSLKEQDEYRRYVIANFVNLRHLDDAAVTNIERLRSFPVQTSIMDELRTFAKELKDTFTIRMPNCIV